MLVLSSIFDICYGITISTYGWSGWTGRDQWGNPYVNSITGTANGVTTNIASMPLYFLRSGNIYNGSLQYAGSDGDYWSSTARGASTAYDLDFLSSGVSPSYNLARYRGLSVRCVAR